MTESSALHGGETPSPWVARFMPLVRGGGAVLDVACGTGRHVRMALARGHRVTGVDKYVAGIAALMGTAGFDFVEADLETGKPWPLADATFDAVVVTNYLYRPLFPSLVGALAPGGVLIYETFALGNERFGRPTNPEFLLRPGELLEAVAGRLQVVAYEHGEVQTPRPAVVQRICATRSEAERPARLPT